MTRAAWALALGFALGCAAPIWTEVSDPQPPPVLRKLALLPLETDPAPGGTVADDAAKVIAARVLQALTEETDLQVVPPDQAALVPGSEGPAGGAALRRSFGVDAVMTGVVRRYVERSGGPGGSARPSAVWFRLELRSTAGDLFWSGTYNETQAALSENLGSLGRAWQRGFRWVTAADLAGYGARQLARALAEETETWN